MVGPVGLDAAALGALVHHLPRLQLEALDELFSGISFGHCPLREEGRHQGQLSLYWRHTHGLCGPNHLNTQNFPKKLHLGHNDPMINFLLSLANTVFY